MNASAAGWNPDPTGRHEYRYWDGTSWTDDVSDQGVTAVDPVGPAGVAGPGGDPTQVVDATQQYGGQPPGVFQPGYAPMYGSSGQVPPAQPPRSGPSIGLIVGVAALAVALIAGVAYAVVAGGDDDDPTAIDTTDTTPTDSTDDTSSDTTADTSSDTTLPTGLDEGPIVELIAAGMEAEADGLITHDQAICAAQAMVDHFGVEALLDLGADPSTDPFASMSPEDRTAVLGAMTDCIPADVLAQIGLAEEGG